MNSKTASIENALSTHKVLRNTYALLSITLIFSAFMGFNNFVGHALDGSSHFAAVHDGGFFDEFHDAPLGYQGWDPGNSGSWVHILANFS